MPVPAPRAAWACNDTSLRPGGDFASEISDPACTEILVIGRSGLLNGIGEGGIRRDELRQLADLHAFLSRQNDLLDQRRRVCAERMRAENFAFSIADKLEEAARRAIDDGAIDVDHLHFVDS